MNVSKSYMDSLWMHYFANRELDALYVSVLLKTLAVALISVFIPVYLLNIGFGLSSVFIFYIVYYVTGTAAYPLGIRLCARLGVKKTMAVGILSLIGAYLLVAGIQSGVPYMAASVLLGLAVGLYYPAYHVDFAKLATKRHGASQYSVLKIIVIIASVVGPITGALIASYGSFALLFSMAALLLVTSIIPLFLSPDERLKASPFSFKKTLASDTRRKAVAYQANGALAVVSGIAWPVFIYLTLGDIVSLGLIITLTSVFMAVIVFFLARLTDKRENAVLLAGTLAHSATWPLRLLMLSPVGIFIGNFIGAATASAIDLSFSRKIYRRAKRSQDMGSYFMFRESNLAIGRIALLLLALASQSLSWMFIAAFFVTQGYLVLLGDKRKTSGRRP